MRRFLVLLPVLLLTSCTTEGSTVQYSLTFSDRAAGRETEILEAAKRMVEQRLIGLGMRAKDLQVQKQDKGASFSLIVAEGKPSDSLAEVVTPEQARNILTSELIGPFAFRLIREAEKGEQAAVTVPRVLDRKNVAFVESGLDESHVLWLTPSRDADEKGAATIQFTPEGTSLLNAIISKTRNKLVGLFVRGRIVSTLINKGEIKDAIVITGIPNAATAQMFADDVNVGTYVRFAELK